MRDYDRGKDVDGPYVPSDAGSDADMEEPKEYQEPIEMPPSISCMFLLLLPREIRDKVCVLGTTSCVRPMLRKHPHTIRFTDMS